MLTTSMSGELTSHLCASSELINYFLLLLRFHFAFANRFYRLDLCLTFLFSIYSFFVVFLSIVLFSSFEVLFKQLFLISFSFNLHSYLLLLSLFLSILFILLTTHSLFHLILLNYSQQQFQQTNQVNNEYLLRHDRSTHFSLRSFHCSDQEKIPHTIDTFF